MVRTRFAPSPTGYMHIGNLRTALYAYLIAKHYGGQFVLRIEDTDQKRNVPEAVQVIFDSLRLAGLQYDEGPDKDGGFGPYIQSQRVSVYKEYAAILLGQGSAYPCFCEKGDATVPVDSADDRKTHDPCRYLNREGALARAVSGEPHVVRQRIPDSGETSMFDHVFGTITVQNEILDDQVLVKSDGFPTYNFANVVDDHLMGITHVVRGVEYLSSTPKYNLLYQAFGWTIPEYVHLPHISKEGGKKLSKREGDASFQDLLVMGYLPNAVVNYVALLGWNPGDEQEFFTLADLERRFDIDRINNSSAAFSFAKLDWLNGEHVRSMTSEQFHSLAVRYYPSAIADGPHAATVSRLIQPRVVRLTGIPAMIAFFSAVPPYEVRLFQHDKSKSTLDSSRQILTAVQSVLAVATEWSNAVLLDLLLSFGKSHGLKTGTVMWPLRIALSGQEATPGGATEIAEVLGKDETLRRIQAAVAMLTEQGAPT
ncbi:MAG: glutamate--tRNA ligase [Thermoanaerobaculaceae bacterium]